MAVAIPGSLVDTGLGDSSSYHRNCAKAGHGIDNDASIVESTEQSCLRTSSFLPAIATLTPRRSNDRFHQPSSILLQRAFLDSYFLRHAGEFLSNCKGTSNCVVARCDCYIGFA